MLQNCYTVSMIPSKDNISTVTDMRRDAIGLLKDVEKKGMKYIFQNSKPMAVMMNMIIFKRFLEMLEDEEDQKRVYEIENEELGKGVSLEDVAKEYGVKLHRKV